MKKGERRDEGFEEEKGIRLLELGDVEWRRSGSHSSKLMVGKLATVETRKTAWGAWVPFFLWEVVAAHQIATTLLPGRVYFRTRHHIYFIFGLTSNFLCLIYLFMYLD